MNYLEWIYVNSNQKCTADFGYGMALYYVFTEGTNGSGVGSPFVEVAFLPREEPRLIAYGSGTIYGDGLGNEKC